MHYLIIIIIVLFSYTVSANETSVSVGFSQKYFDSQFVDSYEEYPGYLLDNNIKTKDKISVTGVLGKFTRDVWSNGNFILAGGGSLTLMILGEYDYKVDKYSGSGDTGIGWDIDFFAEGTYKFHEKFNGIFLIGLTYLNLTIETPSKKPSNNFQLYFYRDNFDMGITNLFLSPGFEYIYSEKTSIKILYYLNLLKLNAWNENGYDPQVEDFSFYGLSLEICIKI